MSHVEQQKDAVDAAKHEHPGKWIAWNDVNREVIAVHADFQQLMALLPQANDPDLVIDMAPGLHPEARARIEEMKNTITPAMALKEITAVYQENGYKWLHMPNDHFQGRTPQELLDGGESYQIYGYLRALREGALLS